MRYYTFMSSITAVLDACPDGTLHLPLPPDLRGIRVRVEAKLEAASSAAKSPVELRAIMQKIRDHNPFRGVGTTIYPAADVEPHPLEPSMENSL